MTVDTVLLEGTPSVVSIGRLVIDGDCDFEWKRKARFAPLLTLKDGTPVTLNVSHYVPEFPDKAEDSIEIAMPSNVEDAVVMPPRADAAIEDAPPGDDLVETVPSDLAAGGAMFFVSHPSQAKSPSSGRLRPRFRI